LRYDETTVTHRLPEAGQVSESSECKEPQAYNASAYVSTRYC